MSEEQKNTFLRIDESNFGAIYRKLIAYFPKNEVQYRIVVGPDKNNKEPNGRGKFAGKFVGLVAFYVDARAICDRLDSVVGPQNWRNDITLTPEGAICKLDILVNGEWISRSDVSHYTDIESTKGGASKSIVRTAAVLGIGRYFYEVDGIWHPCKMVRGNWVVDTEHGINGVPAEPEIPARFLP